MAGILELAFVQVGRVRRKVWVQGAGMRRQILEKPHVTRALGFFLRQETSATRGPQYCLVYPYSSRGRPNCPESWSGVGGAGPLFCGGVGGGPRQAAQSSGPETTLHAGSQHCFSLCQATARSPVLGAWTLPGLERSTGPSAGPRLPLGPSQARPAGAEGAAGRPGLHPEGVCVRGGGPTSWSGRSHTPAPFGHRHRWGPQPPSPGLWFTSRSSITPALPPPSLQGAQPPPPAPPPERQARTPAPPHRQRNSRWHWEIWGALKGLPVPPWPSHTRTHVSAPSTARGQGGGGRGGRGRGRAGDRGRGGRGTLFRGDLQVQVTQKIIKEARQSLPLAEARAGAGGRPGPLLAKDRSGSPRAPPAAPAPGSQAAGR
ncbi:collagen alpha-1(I) chain-like [Sorex araneus]|uniref:collagen alpha-1(I) chain-like n=1 Tax=Sorex araneus TaxID=42254 RepID=UPI0024340447|nr:collagen alpha-1(I) chain-like [Sorex araneus]